jgi:3-hydroxyacyl-CoA dehydrogenase/enoyl-CoA hydratase/3-hydroxybutyryl-CoA epimerase
VNAILGEGKRENGEEALLRMTYLMVNEAARCLSEGIVKTPADVDTGMVFGTGFPPFRGGLLKWADTVGLEAVALTLREYSERFGRRFFPESMLVERKSFY